jgi:hypothetical protein
LAKRKYEQLDKHIRTFLEDRIFAWLRERVAPAVASEICDGVELGSRPDLKLVRQVLQNSERFVRVDRGWGTGVQSIPRSLPLAKAGARIVLHLGRPCALQEVAGLLSASTGLSIEYYLEVLPQLVPSVPELVELGRFGLGHKSWLLTTGPQREEDLRFVNFRSSLGELEAIEEAYRRTRGAADSAKLVHKLLRLAELPISNKVACFIEWTEKGGDVDPVVHMIGLLEDESLRFLSSGHWYDVALEKVMERRLSRVKSFADLEEATEEAEHEITIDEIVVSDEDIEEIANLIAGGERAVSCQVILERLYDVTVQDSVYEKACDKISKALRRRSKFREVGHQLWQLESRIPAHIHSVPEILSFPRVRVSPIADEIIDPELKVDGFEGNLVQTIRDPLLGDVDDTLGLEKPQLADGRYRIVTKYHHAQAGTLPLCQIPDAFFPEGHSLVESALVVIDERGGERKRLVDVGCWVNRETGLVYDLGRLYDQGVSKAGTVMYLESGRQPNSWHAILTADVDPNFHVGPKRISELEEIRKEGEEGEPLSLFEIVQRLMAHYSSGITFHLLHTEVAFIRRTKRHPLASILSAYHCFYQKDPDTAEWHFDERKVDQGFKKQKRKYLKKR